MGLTMSQRKAVTKATATQYRSASRMGKVLGELCELTGWHRGHARRALREALGPHRMPAPRQARPPTYDEDVMVALRTVWVVMDAPAGKRMAPFLPEMVAWLRAFGELDLDDATAARLCGMSAATIDRRLAGERKRLALKGRSGTKPGLPSSRVGPDSAPHPGGHEGRQDQRAFAWQSTQVKPRSAGAICGALTGASATAHRRLRSSRNRWLTGHLSLTG
jgi:hypothetical protein